MSIVPGEPDAQAALVTALRHLYGVEFEDFVSERARLARELRRAGAKTEATVVAGLRKPSAAAWALDHLARD